MWSHGFEPRQRKGSLFADNFADKNVLPSSLSSFVRDRLRNFPHAHLTDCFPQLGDAFCRETQLVWAAGILRTFMNPLTPGKLIKVAVLARNNKVRLDSFPTLAF